MSWCVAMTLSLAKLFVLGVNARCVGEVAKENMGMGGGASLAPKARS